MKMIYITVFLLLWCCRIYAQNSLVDYPHFSEDHKRYLDKHELFAELLVKTYDLNKAKAEVFQRKVNVVYDKYYRKALRSGWLNLAMEIKEHKNADFNIYSCWVFPFVFNSTKDIYYYYFYPPQGESTFRQYVNWKRDLPRELFDDADALASYYRINARKIVTLVTKEVLARGKELDEQGALIAISFRNVQILDQAVNYVKSKTIPIASVAISL